MEIPFVDLRHQNTPLMPDLSEIAADVLCGGQFILGPKTKKLEQEVAQLVGCKNGIAVGSGTDALLLSLMHLEVKPGDTVLVPNYTFSASANVIPRLGAVPILVDIEDPRSEHPFQICPDSMERMIIESEVKPKVAIIVALYGYEPNMEAITKIADKYGIKLIADWAQALDTHLEPQFFETICLSFYPTKNLGGFGDGGMVLTNSDQTLVNLTHLRNHGMTDRYYCTKLGGNFRINEMQAALLLVKLPHVKSYVRERKQVAGIYDDLFKIHCERETTSSIWDNLTIPPQNENYSYNQYVLTFKTEQQRQAVEQSLIDAKIGCCRYYPYTIHQQPLFKDYRYEDEVSSHVAQTSLALPIYPGLSCVQINRIVNIIWLTMQTIPL